MQAIAIVSLLSFGEPDPEALVAQASAVCERIKSYDARYDVEVRDFVPLAAERSHVKEKPGGNPGSQVEVFEKLRDIRFLERGDERAVRKRARVRFVRRGEDFLVRFDDLWIRTPSWTSTSVLVLGRKGGTGLIYRSQPTFEPGSRMAPLEVSTGVLRKAPTFSGFARFGQFGPLGGYGPFSEARSAAHIVHPEVVFDLILASKLVPNLLAQAQERSIGTQYPKLVHGSQLRSGLTEGQTVVISTLAEKPVNLPHASRAMLFHPRKHLMPERIEIWREQLQKAWNVDWAEFVGANGERVWFPTRVQQEDYWLLPGTNLGRLRMVSTAVLDPNNCRVNQRVRDEDLCFEFPPGTVVSDEIAGERYTVMPSGDHAEVHLDDLLRKAANKRTGYRRTRSNLVTIGVALVLSMLMVMVLYLRRRRTALSPRGTITGSSTGPKPSDSPTEPQ